MVLYGPNMGYGRDLLSESFFCQVCLIIKLSLFKIGFVDNAIGSVHLPLVSEILLEPDGWRPFNLAYF